MQPIGLQGKRMPKMLSGSVDIMPERSKFATN